MELSDIDFTYDLNKKTFSHISLKITLIVPPESSTEEIKSIAINDFKQFEDYFDKKLLSLGGVVKEITGSEFTSFLFAGYTYRSKGTWTSGINCQIDYHFSLCDKNFKIPQINISLDIIENLNYWILENIIETMNNIKLSDQAQNTLNRIRSKMYSENESSPTQLLLEFSDSNSIIEGKEPKKVLMRTKKKQQLRRIEDPSNFLPSELNRITKKLARKNRSWFFYLCFFLLLLSSLVGFMALWSKK